MSWFSYFYLEGLSFQLFLFACCRESFRQLRGFRATHNQMSCVRVLMFTGSPTSLSLSLSTHPRFQFSTTESPPSLSSLAPSLSQKRTNTPSNTQERCRNPQNEGLLQAFFFLSIIISLQISLLCAPDTLSLSLSIQMSIPLFNILLIQLELTPERMQLKPNCFHRSTFRNRMNIYLVSTYEENILLQLNVE